MMLILSACVVAFSFGGLLEASVDGNMLSIVLWILAGAMWTCILQAEFRKLKRESDSE